MFTVQNLVSQNITYLFKTKNLSKPNSWIEFDLISCVRLRIVVNVSITTIKCALVCASQYENWFFPPILHVAIHSFNSKAFAIGRLFTHFLLCPKNASQTQWMSACIDELYQMHILIESVSGLFLCAFKQY